MTGQNFVGGLAALWFATAAFMANPARAETFAGPVSATAARALDGDTIEVKARLWIGLSLTINVRVRGIDTPEIHQPQCASEKTMGLAARDRLIALAGNEVKLGAIESDKYGGRVDADVTAADGTDVASAMIASGLARPYSGSGPRLDWCPVGEVK